MWCVRLAERKVSIHGNCLEQQSDVPHQIDGHRFHPEYVANDGQQFIFEIAPQPKQFSIALSRFRLDRKQASELVRLKVIDVRGWNDILRIGFVRRLADGVEVFDKLVYFERSLRLEGAIFLGRLHEMPGLSAR